MADSPNYRVPLTGPPDCPEPWWHASHRFCPRCTWTDSERVATFEVNWIHPTVGEQTELLCDEHNKQIGDALRTLAMGSISRSAPDGSTCGRCGKPLPWRNYLFAEATP